MDSSAERAIGWVLSRVLLPQCSVSILSCRRIDILGGHTAQDIKLYIVILIDYRAYGVRPSDFVGIGMLTAEISRLPVRSQIEQSLPVWC